MAFPTGSYQHPKCYLRELGGCSEELSKEHYISKGILERFAGGGKLGVTGFRGAVEEVTLSTNNLASKVLCVVHNHALHPLDSLATEFIGYLEAVLVSFGSGKSLSRAAHSAFSGDDIERWFLKLAIGFFKSAHLGFGKTTSLSSQALRFLTGDDELPQAAGLYFRKLPSTSLSKGLGVNGIFDVRRRNILGCVLQLYGFPITFWLHTNRPGDDFLRRPNSLRFVSHEGRAVIHLSWEDQGSGDHLQVTFE